MDWIDIVVGGIVAIFIVGGCLALYADATSHPWEDSDMTNQCKSCGGFCKKSGCERKNVKPTIDLIERLRLGDGTSPDHELLLEAADALETLAQPKEPEQNPVALQDDEIYDAAFSAYCRGGASSDLFRIMWSNSVKCSIGWDRDELKSFARNIAALYTAPPQLKPLSDEEILNIHAMKCWVRVQFSDKKYGIALDTVTVRDFSRAIIAAHEAKRGGV